MATSALVVFSGGPDSTACALWAKQNGYEPELLTFVFDLDSQADELAAAMSVAKALKMKHRLINFTSPMRSFSSNVHILMHAGTPPLRTDKTVDHLLPFGAGLVLGFASSVAIYNGFEHVIWGATRDDGASNPEYRQEFGDKLADLVRIATGVVNFKIHVPFSGLHKYEVVRNHFVGREDLFSMTWSDKRSACESRGVQAGNTKSTVARRLAAHFAGIKDLTAYGEQSFKHHLSAAQMANPKLVSDDDWIIIFESPKPGVP